MSRDIKDEQIKNLKTALTEALSCIEALRESNRILRLTNDRICNSVQRVDLLNNSKIIPLNSNGSLFAVDG